MGARVALEGDDGGDDHGAAEDDAEDDAEAGGSASVRVRVTDSFGFDFEKILTVTIDDDRTEDEDLDGLTEEEEDSYGTSDIEPDTDGDGFGDGFEVDRGLNPSSGLDGLGDRDRDGLADWLELRMGTDPDVPDPGGVFTFDLTANAAGEPVVNLGPGAPGVGFCIERTTDPSAIWLPLQDYPAGLSTGQTLDFVDDDAPLDRAFYRVGIYPIAPAP